MVRLAIAISILFARGSLADPGPQPLLGTLRHLPPALLVASFGGGHSGGRAPAGAFLGVDTGWAWLVGEADASARATASFQTDAWCFGARFGYQLRSGLAVQTRYEHLGVSAPDGSGSLSFVTAGVRYALPAEIEPFAEVEVGPAFHGSGVSAGAGLGIGIAVLATRHVAFEAAGRDWLVDLGGVRHAPTVTFGIAAGFGG